MGKTTFFLLALFAARALSQSTTVPVASLASQYSLSTSTSLPFPTATLSNSDAQSFITSNWALSKGRIQNGAPDIDFVNDPFSTKPAPDGTNSSGPVLRVVYPQGSYQSNDQGGAQFYVMWNSTGSAFQSMMLSYELTFDQDFPWVKGGKLPGLRGGPDPVNCSGGNQANGTNCFSTRLMWRPSGNGEVYAYVPRENNICNDTGVVCNDEYGISVDRGSFTFARGQWNHVTMLVRLNSPTDTANGQVTLFFNGVQVLDHDDIYFRQKDVITTGGLYFSTFFGGSDPSWAPPNLTHTYFRNFQLYAGTSPSNLKGAKVASAANGRPQWPMAGPLVTTCFVLLGLFVW